MSPEVRAAALTQAVIYNAGKDGLAAVLNAAAQFAAFIGEGAVAAKPSKTENVIDELLQAKRLAVSAANGEGAVAAKPSKTEKAAKAEKAPVQEPETPAEPEGPTQDQVANVIDELLQANLRKQTVELLGKFKAKNASSVKAEDRAAFIEQAGALLLAG